MYLPDQKLKLAAGFGFDSLAHLSGFLNHEF